MNLLTPEEIIQREVCPLNIFDERIKFFDERRYN